MAELADALSDQLHSVVIDTTELTGKFDLTLEYAQDNIAIGPPDALDSSAPGLPAALREQLGLILEWRTMPVSVLVVDNAGPATAN